MTYITTVKIYLEDGTVTYIQTDVFMSPVQLQIKGENISSDHCTCFMQSTQKPSDCLTKPVCPSLSCPLDSLPPRGQANRCWLAPQGASCPRISYYALVILTPGGGGKLSRPIYLAPRPYKENLLCDVYYYLQHYNNYMQFLSYNYVNLNDYFKHSFGFLIDKGWGASCPGQFILPPAQNFRENG